LNPVDNQTACRSFFDGVLTAIRLFLEPGLDLWQVLKLCRFAVLTILLTGVFLNTTSQGQEVLIHLQTLQDGWVTQNVLFFIGVLAWTWGIWYWSRVIVSFRYPHWPPSDATPEQNPERLKRILRYHLVVPRVLGVLAILVIAFGFLWSIEGRTAKAPVFGNAGFYLVFAGLFGLMTVRRHDWAKDLRTKYPRIGNLIPDPLPKEDDPRLGALYIRSHDTSPEDTIKKHYLPEPTLKTLLWSFILFFLLPLFIFQTPSTNLAVAPLAGPAAILLLAAASWVPLGTLVIYWSNCHRIPILSLLFVYVILISPYTDNHAVRTLPGTTKEADGSPLADRFNGWLERHILLKKESQEPIPVFLIAAEGGGIRGAYWTASVLSRIQQDRPDFASHVFVISGVSGGSLGAAVFSGLIADQGDGGSCSNHHKFLDCSKQILRQDFLASTFATMLYPDLLQRFLFWPIPSWDRARTIEMSWEQAWGYVTKTQPNRFAEPFENLWTGPHSAEVPNLIFNSTSVEQGKRVLMSNLPIGNPTDSVPCLETWTGHTTGVFDDAIDLSQALNTKEKCPDRDNTDRSSKTVRLSTAVNNSARFSFISPAGTVNHRLHIVDGGYFEISGMTTLEEVFRTIGPVIDEKNANGHEKPLVIPIVLYISNTPELLDVGVRYIGPLKTSIPAASPECIQVEIQGSLPEELKGFQERRCGGNPALPQNEIALKADKSVREQLKRDRSYTLLLDRDNMAVGLLKVSSTYLDEVFTPLTTMFRSQDARGRYAFQHLRRQAQADPRNLSGRFIRFRLRASSANLPLGWTLSTESADEMDDQLEKQFESDNCKPTPTQTLWNYVESCWPR